MVNEATIEEVLESYINDREEYVHSLSDLMDQQPPLLAFLAQESNDVLTEEEKDVLWYIILIIVTSSRRFGVPIGELSDVDLGNFEETNWEILQQQPKGTFRDKITPFFDGYEQEDLLAFVEDTLELDEDSPVTSVGRDVIFISAKTVIDSIFNFQN